MSSAHHTHGIRLRYHVLVRPEATQILESDLHIVEQVWHVILQHLQSCALQCKMYPAVTSASPTQSGTREGNKTTFVPARKRKRATHLSPHTAGLHCSIRDLQMLAAGWQDVLCCAVLCCTRHLVRSLCCTAIRPIFTLQTAAIPARHSCCPVQGSKPPTPNTGQQLCLTCTKGLEEALLPHLSAEDLF